MYPCSSKKVLGIVAMLYAIALTAGCNNVGISEMHVEYIEDPISISTCSPRFTWVYNGNGSSFEQESFTLDVFHEGEMVWSSGKIQSPLSNFQSYPPLPLQSTTHYEWQITACGKDGKTRASGRSGFDTAILDGDAWMAGWINDGRGADVQQAPVLRKDFIVRGKPDKARLYWSAAAYADIYINGRRLETTALNPAFTHYDKRNLYESACVDSFLLEGENVILAILGNGFYNCIEKTAVWDYENARWRNRPSMICRMDLHYPDGRLEIIGSDSSWKVLPSGSGNPFTMNNIYSGDHFDVRNFEQEMALPGYDASEWFPAKEVDAPSNLLTAQYMGRNVVDEEYDGKILMNVGDSVFVVDFGYNVSGYSKLSVKGHAGTVVKVQHGEKLDSAGRLDVNHLDEHFRPKPGHEFQTDVYVLAEGENCLEPRFNYHGFRYAEIRADVPVHFESAKSLFIHTDVTSAGDFRCSDTTLGQIRSIVNRSWLSNHMGIPTDCPQREKNGWTADAYTACETGILNFDCANAYMKWMDDMADNQADDGQVTAIIPSSGWGYGFGPVWDAAIFMIPETFYNYYGDLRAIQKMTPVCEKYLSWLKTRESPDGIIAYGLADWVTWMVDTPNSFTSTCYYWKMHSTLARFEDLLGNAEKAREYASKADMLKEKINTLWFKREESTYANGSQCALSLPLWLGIVPEESAASVAARLSESISANGDKLAFGMIGSKTVLRALCKYGYQDLAYKMAADKSAPGWAWWIEQGFTTPPEVWVPEVQGKFYSMNHVFLGDIDAWMFNCLAGINPDPEDPGFHHVIFKPVFPEGLEYAEATYHSVSGTIHSGWRRSRSGVVLTVEIPANTTGTVMAGSRVMDVPAGKTVIRL